MKEIALNVPSVTMELTSIELSEIGIDGFSVYPHNLNSREGRGMVTYISTKLNYTEISLENSFSEYQYFEIMMRHNLKFHLVIIYRSPSSAEVNNEKLWSLLEDLAKSEPENLLIMGDFNLPSIEWSLNICIG